MVSFLNALLPLTHEQEIVEIEYLPEELLANPEIKKAVNALEESAFTPAQLLGYEKFWDIISTEKTLISGGIRKGLEEGIAKGKIEGLAEDLAKGFMEAKQEDARKMKTLGLATEVIANITGLTFEEIETL